MTADPSKHGRQVSVTLDFWVPLHIDADEFGERVLCLFEQLPEVVTQPDGLLIVEATS